MGEFKPMVKMETTEPSVELKLKKGGSVGHKCMKKGGGAHGHKMMDGGLPPTVGAPTGGLAASAAPKRPALSLRRRAMASKQAPVMKTGGVVKGQGGFKTGGVVKGQGGFATGGAIPKETTSGTTKTTLVHQAKKDTAPAKTGDVKLGNAGGFKKGGATKKFASGGSVNDSGRAQQMPQGKKTPSSAVSIDRLAGTFKKGGNVSSKALQAKFKEENAPAVKASKADSDLKYSKYQKSGKKFADGGASDSDYADVMMREKMGKAYNKTLADETAENEATSKAMRDALLYVPRKIGALYDKAKASTRGQGAVTDKETTISRTVTPPARKCGGKVKK